jgi:hypothetical protein
MIVSLALGMVPTALVMHLWNRLQAVPTAPPLLVRLETPPPVCPAAPACPACPSVTVNLSAPPAAPPAPEPVPTPGPEGQTEPEVPAAAPPDGRPRLVVELPTGDGPHFEMKHLPAVSQDGRQLVHAYVRDDGARGNANLHVDFFDARSARRVKSVVVLDADELDRLSRSRPLLERVLRLRLARVQALLDQERWRALEPSVALRGFASMEQGLKTRDLVGSLTVSYAEPWFSVDEGGRTLLRRKMKAWSARREECGDHPAYVSALWTDPDSGVLLVGVSYVGSCGCWEPAGGFHLVRIPGAARL